MKQRDPKSLEGLLQKKLEGYAPDPPPHLWSKIARETAPQKLRFLARRLNTNLHWLNFAASILLLIVALFFWYQPKFTSTELALPKIEVPMKQHIKGVPDSIDSLQRLLNRHEKLNTKTNSNHENQ